MLEVNTCVHVCVVAKYCVFVCIICVCMCGERRGGVSGCSHSLIVLYEFCAMCASEHAVSYHVVSKNTEVWTHTQPPHSHPNLHPTQTLSTDTVRKHRLTLHVCCCLWPLPVSVGFTGSFTPPCHASPHWRPLNTDSLYSHSSAWEGASATHTKMFSFACVSLFFQWWKVTKCIYSKTYFNTGLRSV